MYGVGVKSYRLTKDLQLLCIVLLKHLCHKEIVTVSIESKFVTAGIWE